MEDHDYDYLIVGQGIAGTSLAMHLLDLGKKILIINNSGAPSSSKVAAGIFNPLTGKKLVKTWLADDLFPYAKGFYSYLEAIFGEKIVHQAPIYRPFRSITEQNTYLAQTADPTIAFYIKQSGDLADLSDYIHADFGGLEVIKSGWIDLPLLLEQSRNYFLENDWLVDEQFEFNGLSVSKEAIVWKGKTFGKLVLCQGFMALENDFFSWLPFTPVKGQILEIETDVALQDYIVNQGIFMFPVGEKVSRVGATYSWEPLDWEPTEEATAELKEKLDTLLKIPYQVKSEVAGIRPSVRDRRPLIGVHPEYDNVAIFNGLGTKGVTLAPFFANELAQHLENGKELNPLVNIQRYFSLYFR
ncbi:FAD-binding oxidoreductase [Dyadobacter chenwenxiniae]|uniref:FAD-binding oxidoreductase n=1 Tax=Dyadobacter chenwenxiniae TaxID=2906456 RepID=A0A9X1TGI3_9BACT|nr:FAD-binding oxidoreductase [Dyadobacter chenwenxiniae]MCF0063654.1 FAD-binding oxidoreductase [Dyadobacter chenwenxiniae]UON83330.1 FAD-binding oxidoreductase [Dyadobacter chenwenxiniae]